MYLRQAFGPFAQGPVALISRFGDECVFSVDALGLRPLWQLETADAYVFSSEPGVVAVSDTISEPKPLAPGEKVMVGVDRDRAETVLRDHGAMQELCAERWRRRTGTDVDDYGYAGAILTGGPLSGAEIPGYTSAGPSEPVKVEDRVLGGFGWQRDDMKLVQQMAATGAGADRLARLRRAAGRLSPERQNLADYFKESVAVVTNPAIDREREVEHFSCRAVLGARPSIDARSAGEAPRSRSPSRCSSAATTTSRRCPTRLPPDRPRAQDLPARGPVGGVPRPQRACSTSRASSRRTPAEPSSASSTRPRRPCAAARSCWC